MELTLSEAVTRFFRYFFKFLPNHHTRLFRYVISQSICELCRCKCTCHPMICNTCLHDLVRFDYQKLNDNLLNWPAINKTINHKNYQKLIAIAPYQWPYDHWIKRLKFSHHFEYASLLAILLKPLIFEQIINTTQAEIIFTIVPLHIKKWQQRGFNQCHLIFSSICKSEAITYLPNLVSKVDDSSSQVGQTGKQRRKNLASSFVVDTTQDLKDKHLVIFDDVLTTGTTVDSIAKQLKAVGVKEVTVVTIALSLPFND